MMEQESTVEVPSTSDDLSKQIIMQENEIKKMRDEFNGQRAKMKEMYIQKENELKKLVNEANELRKELNEAKSQIYIAEMNKSKDLEDQNRKAQEEIQNLQQIVNETVEELSVSICENKPLADENERIRQENQELKELLSQQQESGLVPVLSHVRKIARKLGASDSSSHDNLEDSMRKAQEDAEVLRSLVVPLEEEIKTLKEKLRKAYDEMEQFRGNDFGQESALVGMLKESQKEQAIPNTLDNTTESTKVLLSDHNNCEMCKNYETQLVQSQNNLIEEKQKTAQAEKITERLREEITKEVELRRDLESEWQEKRDQHKNEVQKLNEQINKTTVELKSISSNYSSFKDDLHKELLRLSQEREQVYHRLETLQTDNNYLSGKYLEHSEALKDQVINLPQDVDALNELVLKMHEELIETKCGCEYAEAKHLTFQTEADLLRDQLHSRDRDRQLMETELKGRIVSLEERLKNEGQEKLELNHSKDELEKREAEHKKHISELRLQIIEIQETCTKQDRVNSEMKLKMSVLQQELAMNETVQKDFVKLSQSLQMQLEKIRSEDTQVRWQDEDDIDQCYNCKKEFTVTRRKQHCRHCGAIYCCDCLKKTVPSGTGGKPAHVCDVCHTLLLKNTAPYFSREVPQSP